MDSLWPSLAAELKKELPAQQFDTWIKPLRAERHGEQLLLLEEYGCDMVQGYYLGRPSNAEAITDMLGKVTLALPVK